MQREPVLAYACSHLRRTQGPLAPVGESQHSTGVCRVETHLNAFEVE